MPDVNAKQLIYDINATTHVAEGNEATALQEGEASLEQDEEQELEFEATSAIPGQSLLQVPLVRLIQQLVISR